MNDCIAQIALLKDVEYEPALGVYPILVVLSSENMYRLQVEVTARALAGRVSQFFDALLVILMLAEVRYLYVVVDAGLRH